MRITSEVELMFELVKSNMYEFASPATHSDYLNPVEEMKFVQSWLITLLRVKNVVALR